MGNKIHQIDIALVHLEKACELFFGHDSICALTLAAAAEEVLGEMANRESKKLLDRKEKHEKGISALNLTAVLMEDFHGISYIDYLKEKNSIKNSFKHAMPSYETNVAKLDESVKQFITDAITNYKLLSLELPNLPNIQKFCIEFGVS